MRNFLTLLFVLALGASTVSAQEFGLRGGVNFTNVNVEQDGISLSFDAQTKFMLGAFLDLPLGGDKIFLSPEVSYVGRGYGFEFEFFGQSTDLSVNLNYLDLGLLAKAKLVDNGSLGVYAGAGPILAYALNGNSSDGTTTEDIDFDDEDGFNRANLNLAIVGGLTFGDKFFVEARYMLGLNSLNDEDPTFEGTTKWTSIGVNGGVRFPLGN